MFSQQIINEYVTIEIVIGIVFVVLAIGIFLYHWIDYKLFCRRLEKGHKKEQNNTPKNLLL